MPVVPQMKAEIFAQHFHQALAGRKGFLGQANNQLAAQRPDLTLRAGSLRLFSMRSKPAGFRLPYQGPASMVLDYRLIDFPGRRQLLPPVSVNDTGRQPITRNQAIQLPVSKQVLGQNGAFRIETPPSRREGLFRLTKVPGKPLSQPVPVVPGQQEMLSQIPQLDLDLLPQRLPREHVVLPVSAGQGGRMEIFMELLHLASPGPECPHEVRHRESSSKQ